VDCPSGSDAQYFEQRNEYGGRFGQELLRPLGALTSRVMVEMLMLAYGRASSCMTLSNPAREGGGSEAQTREQLNRTQAHWLCIVVKVLLADTFDIPLDCLPWARPETRSGLQCAAGYIADLG